MIRVCDALPGSGKTSAAINYINEHPNEKFIYVAPYVEDFKRIKKSCPTMRFIEPSNKIDQYNFKKSDHLVALVKEGRNIITTQQSFKNYANEMLDDIRSLGYTLILDEMVSVIDSMKFNMYDMGYLKDINYVEEDNGVFRAGEESKVYRRGLLIELFTLLRTRELIKIDEEIRTMLQYWMLPPDLIKSFKDVFILTYMFDTQNISYLLKMYNIEYENIVVEKRDDGFYFGKESPYIPDYYNHLSDLIHISDHEKLNRVGEDYHDLSMAWFSRNKAGVEQLRKNINNYFCAINKSTPCDKRLWTSYSEACRSLRGKGYINSFLMFNARNSDEHKDKDCLAYAVNLFMNENEKKLYNKYNIEVGDDKYALAKMIQWIWRSAIREGKPINIYIPSKRMRDLLIGWINSLTPNII